MPYRHLLLTMNQENVNYRYVIKYSRLLIGHMLVTWHYGLSWSIFGSFVFFGLFRVGTLQSASHLFNTAVMFVNECFIHYR